MKQLFILITCFAISNCSSNETSEKPINEAAMNQASKETALTATKNSKLSLKNKHQEISKLIGKNCDSQAQCKVIGVGLSACGGFASYKVYSEKDTNVEALKQSVSQFNQTVKAHNQKNKVVGICRHIEAPEVTCQANQCTVLNSRHSL